METPLGTGTRATQAYSVLQGRPQRRSLLEAQSVNQGIETKIYYKLVQKLTRLVNLVHLKLDNDDIKTFPHGEIVPLIF